VITSSWLWLEQDPPLEFARGPIVVDNLGLAFGPTVSGI
jgi:hypothetical protein